MENKVCGCPGDLLYDLYLAPRKKREDDLGPPENGWCLLRGHTAINVTFCPFCGGNLSGRPEKVED